MRGRRAAEAIGGTRSTGSARIGGSGGCRRRLAAGGARATGHARPLREPAAAADRRSCPPVVPGPGGRRRLSRPLAPPAAVCVAVAGGVAGMAAAAGSRAVGRRWASRERGGPTVRYGRATTPGIDLKTT